MSFLKEAGRGGTTFLLIAISEIWIIHVLVKIPQAMNVPHLVWTNMPSNNLIAIFVIPVGVSGSI